MLQNPYGCVTGEAEEAMNVRHLASLACAIALSLATGTASSASAVSHKAVGRPYVVRPGDGGWWKVAQAHGVTLPQLLAANHATAATPLRVGQTVMLPPQAHDPAKAAKAAHGKASAASANKTAAPARPAPASH
jgi:hypothetical protein